MSKTTNNPLDEPQIITSGRTQIIKKQTAELKQHKESAARASEEVSGLKAKISSWDKKHRKYRSDRDTLSKEKAKVEEELVGTKSQLEHRERQVEEIQGNIASFFHVGVERGLRMDHTDKEFRGLSHEVAGFIPDATEKFNRVIAAFPDTTFSFLDKVSQHSQSSLQYIARLEPDRVTPSSQPSSATASLRTSTHVRHSTSSSETFGHISIPEHLKKKK
ncbi:hypothetical protein Tco_0489982 [Tanacetum coccineum]